MILCIIIVKLRRGNNFARNRGKGLFIPEHRNFHLLPDHRFFHNNLKIMLRGKPQAFYKLIPAGAFADAYAAARACRLHKNRIGQRLLQILHHAVEIRKRPAVNHLPFCLKDPRFPADQLSQRLIHGIGRTGHRGGYLGNARKLQQCGNRTVFPVFAVQHRNRAVQRDHLPGGGTQAAHRRIRKDPGRRVIFPSLPGTAADLFRPGPGQHPGALPGNADFMYCIFFILQQMEHIANRTAGYFIFRRFSAE